MVSLYWWGAGEGLKRRGKEGELHITGEGVKVLGKRQCGQVSCGSAAVVLLGREVEVWLAC